MLKLLGIIMAVIGTLSAIAGIAPEFFIPKPHQGFGPWQISAVIVGLLLIGGGWLICCKSKKKSCSCCATAEKK